MPKWRLTARPWKPAELSAPQLLDTIEGICRWMARYQNADGAIIDPFPPFQHEEVKYATGYFASAVATLVHAGKARDLLPAGIRAMDQTTGQLAKGYVGSRKNHGNFVLAPLTIALDLYRGHVPAGQLEVWRTRMQTPLLTFHVNTRHNWETYSMKGEWMRVEAGLADRAAATAFIERAWRTNQRQRIVPTLFNLYHDTTSDPDTLSVDAVGRGNLLGMLEAGYDGPSKAEILKAVEQGTGTALLLQDPSGQTPVNGRADNHVWVDVGYGLAFDVMAKREFDRGDRYSAGQFRQAANKAFLNISRWRHTNGSFSVTKNRFDPMKCVGYKGEMSPNDSSSYTEYNSSMVFHLAEAFHLRGVAIAPQPSPNEIGGYSLTTDASFASAFANAGGMMVQINLRGQTAESNGNWWTPLGIARLARVDWDTRLGPSDGAIRYAGKSKTRTVAVSFGPEFKEGGEWVRLAELPSRYRGTVETGYTSPVLVKVSVRWEPQPGQTGPEFLNHLTITPDGVLSELTCTTKGVEFGQSLPLLYLDGDPEFGGRRLAAGYSAAARIARVSYPGGSDEQNFIVLNAKNVAMCAAPPIRGSYGDLLPVRATAAGTTLTTFIYPRGAGDPAAEAVRDSFQITPAGFKSMLGWVDGAQYAGRTSAGGDGESMDLDRDGQPEIRFSESCTFNLQRGSNGGLTRLETDRPVTVRTRSRTIRLNAFEPQALER